MRNVKKTIGWIALSLVLGLGGFVSYNQLNPKLVSSSGSSFLDDNTFDGLVRRSDLIVRVQLQSKGSQVLKKGSDELPLDYYTFSTVRVMNVYQGTAGERLTIIEPYAIWRQLHLAQIISTGGYAPLKKEGVYTMFLSKSNRHPETYEVVGGAYGKYLVSETGQADPDVPLGGDGYRKLYETVMERFPESSPDSTRSISKEEAIRTALQGIVGELEPQKVVYIQEWSPPGDSQPVMPVWQVEIAYKGESQPFAVAYVHAIDNRKVTLVNRSSHK